MGKTPRILIVDDSPHFLWLAQTNLQLHGYEVLLAVNGQMAIETVTKEQPDLVILYVEMPGLDGYAACRRIRAFSDVPIIMLSGRAQAQDCVRGLDMGADQYLTKPCSMQELLARVESLLRRGRYPVRLVPRALPVDSVSPRPHEND